MTSKKDHIAIIGAGFSGLACAFYLSKAGYPVTLYDPAPIGKNASGISAGLLHFYTGPKAKPSIDAEEKLNSTLELLKSSSEALGFSVFKQTGLFRPALSIEQEKNYRQRADAFKDLRWMEPDETAKLYPELRPLPGIWIENGYTINTKKYLEGLWQACKKMGAQWETKEINNPGDLESGTIIAATGASPLLRGLQQPIHPIKGQILEIEWDIQLPFPISANIYFVPGSSPKRCFIGGTFEHQFQSTEPDISAARELLFPKIHSLFPQFTGCTIINCQAALRGSTPNRLPICAQIDDKLWVFAGLGSKGLLHHAFYAKKLIKLILPK